MERKSFLLFFPTEPHIFHIKKLRLEEFMGTTLITKISNPGRDGSWSDLSEPQGHREHSPGPVLSGHQLREHPQTAMGYHGYSDYFIAEAQRRYAACLANKWQRWKRREPGVRAGHLSSRAHCFLSWGMSPSAVALALTFVTCPFVCFLFNRLSLSFF